TGPHLTREKQATACFFSPVPSFKSSFGRILIISDENRAEVFARASGRCVTADDELLFVNAFKFDPGAASTARFVNGLTLLSDDAFQPAPLYLLEQRLHITLDLAGITDRLRYVRAKLRQ